MDLIESEFKYLFTLEEHIVLNNGTYINNEFQDIYFIKKDIDITDIKLTDGEVEAVKFLPLNMFELWLSGKGEPIVPHEEEYKRLLEYI